MSLITIQGYPAANENTHHYAAIKLQYRNELYACILKAYFNPYARKLSSN